jgi:hypothetical protein
MALYIALASSGPNGTAGAAAIILHSTWASCLLLTGELLRMPLPSCLGCSPLVGESVAASAMKPRNLVCCAGSQKCFLVSRVRDI